ncbi:unnamed protein product [Ambrosiozyma monospora]|uniref:Unnamed protein product n=1 Tax=Ambrosiozyma monospora TaxID=43982 RepID=A0ACB5TA22_AMBMO|nr:unnamed protein product [Ambrosiozyma monospora]
MLEDFINDFAAPEATGKQSKDQAIILDDIVKESNTEVIQKDSTSDETVIKFKKQQSKKHDSSQKDNKKSFQQGSSTQNKKQVKNSSNEHKNKAKKMYLKTQEVDNDDSDDTDSSEYMDDDLFIDDNQNDNYDVVITNVEKSTYNSDIRISEGEGENEVEGSIDGDEDDDIIESDHYESLSESDSEKPVLKVGKFLGKMSIDAKGNRYITLPKMNFKKPANFGFIDEDEPQLSDSDESDYYDDGFFSDDDLKMGTAAITKSQKTVFYKKPVDRESNPIVSEAETFHQTRHTPPVENDVDDDQESEDYEEEDIQPIRDYITNVMRRTLAKDSDDDDDDDDDELEDSDDDEDDLEVQLLMAQYKKDEKRLTEEEEDEKFIRKLADQQIGAVADGPDNDEDDDELGPEFGFLPEDYVSFDVSQIKVSNIRMGASFDDTQFEVTSPLLLGTGDACWLNTNDFADYLIEKGIPEHRIGAFLKYATAHLENAIPSKALSPEPEYSDLEFIEDSSDDEGADESDSSEEDSASDYGENGNDSELDEDMLEEFENKG